jgi:hypothetical protein
MNKKDKRRQTNASIIIGNLNQKSYKDALQTSKELGIPFKKIWTGALHFIDKKPSYCHLDYEALGYVDMDYEYSPGLKFPCDPDCIDKNETENCKCSIGFKVLGY